MEKKRRKSHRVSLLRLAWILLLMMTLTTGVLSRFVARSQSADLARVAKFVFDVSLKQETAVVRFDSIEGKIRKPGDAVEFQLEVLNQSGQQISEVSENYEIAIAIDGSMPLTCKLIPLGQTEPVMIWSNTATVGFGQTPAVYRDVLEPGIAQADSYCLQVQWPDGENSRKYANGSAAGELTVTFTSTQVD